MSFSNYISEKVLLPIGDFVTGQSVYKHLHFLSYSQFWDKEKIRNFQLGKLKQVIHHSVNNVPYYRDLFSAEGIKVDDIKTLDDLKRIPILNKSTIQREGIDRFTSKGFLKRNTIQSSSSGSTGEPLFYLRTKDAYSMNLASSLRGWYWMGYRLGDNYIKLSQNGRDTIIKKFQDRISHNRFLATNPLIEFNFRIILEEIERYKPKIIRCYPDPLLFIARYRVEHPEFKYKPLAIATTGNTLHNETRDEIETAFGCSIFDAYNCEGNSTVFECPSHSCYHSAEEYGISEVLDEKGSSVKSGIGRLVSTDLWNLAHPFIRYDTQDLVEVSDQPCVCGRKHLRINRIIGRDNDIIVAPNGQKFIVHNFTGFFHTDNKIINRSIEQFQVIKKEDLLIIKIIVNQRYTSSVADYIKNYWGNEMNINVAVEIVQDIPLTKNGKRKFIINN